MCELFLVWVVTIGDIAEGSTKFEVGHQRFRRF
ncbi:hypothetical protein N825_09795 [Skermanella stibiiresistens SB22]|uniref:Uncharacterized protein n=1 Tax=Skermanella stibiiresistens SB22 TaxID=1385369 RepID=W9GS73_9PROT|nr:hypothetical protein N825_09795 [Skermanella stibiiresistens SB22]